MARRAVHNKGISMKMACQGVRISEIYYRYKLKAISVPDGIIEVWSLDFMRDQLTNLRSFWWLNVIDDCNREALAIKIDFPLPADRLIRALGQIIGWRGRPEIRRGNSGPENARGAVQAWAGKHGAQSNTSSPESRSRMPTSSASIKRFVMTSRLRS